MLEPEMLAILTIDAAESRRLRELPYDEFLNEPYWRAVSRLVKDRDKHRCQKCGRPGDQYRRLEVHHLRYDKHGKEHRHLGDLRTLCSECHRKFHMSEREGFVRVYKRRKIHSGPRTHKKWKDPVPGKKHSR
jgi:5-methylcytosine-specific restriction endonuclease McrA